MYSNLRGEMTRHGVRLSMVQNLLGVTEKTARDRVNGKSDFSVTEALKVRDAFFPGMTIGYLFAHADRKEE